MRTTASLMWLAAFAYGSLQQDWLCTQDSFVNLCSIVPKGPDGRPQYNNGSIPGAPWVIGRHDTLTLRGGSAISPGLAPGFPLPLIFVVENGALEFVGGESKKEISMHAIVAACDHASVSLRGPVSLRLNQTSPQQLPWVMAGSSKMNIAGPGVEIFPNSIDLGPKVQGQWLTVAAQTSTISATDGPALPRMFLDAWELASVGAAHTQLLRAGPFLSETYVQGDAYLGYEDSAYFDIFFELCSPAPAGGQATAGQGSGQLLASSSRAPREGRGSIEPGLAQLQTLLDLHGPASGLSLASKGRQAGTSQGINAPGHALSSVRSEEDQLAEARAHLHLPALPELCSPGQPGPGGLPECFQPTQKALDFVLQPPSSSFTFNCSSSKIFSWCVSSHPQTNLTVESATRYSNLGIGLGGITGNLDLTLVIGPDAHTAGLLDRTVTVGTPGKDDGFVGSWSVWGGDIPSQIKVEPGSTVGDFTLPQGSVGLLAPQVQLTEGQVLEGNGTLVLCVGCMMGDQVAVQQGAAMLLKFAQAQGAFNVQGTLVVSRSTKEPSASYYIPAGFGGEILEVELASPANNSVVKSGGITVTGTLLALGEGLVPVPKASFPTAFVAQQRGCVTDSSGDWDVIRIVPDSVQPGGSLLPGGWTPPSCQGPQASTLEWWSIGTGFIDVGQPLDNQADSSGSLVLRGLGHAQAGSVRLGFDPRGVALNASIDAVCVQIQCQALI